MTNEELVEQIQAGINVKDNMEMLYKQVCPYIRKIVFPYSKCFGKHVPGTTGIFEFDDLMNEAYFSLCKAIEKYDVNQGKFMTFASHFIKLDMKRFVESSSLIHIPVGKANLIWKYSSLLKKYKAASDILPTDKFFSDELGISENQFKELKKYFQIGNVLSMDLKGTDDEADGGLYNKLEGGKSPESDVMDSIVEEKLMSIWKEAERICNEREVYVLKQHYIQSESFQEIGNQMGKCAEIARRHNVKALEKLKTDSEIISIAELYFDDYDCKAAFRYGVERFNETWESSTEHIAMKHLEVEPWLQEDGLQKLRSWKQAGMTREQIAKRIGIHRVTLGRWCRQYDSIRKALNAS